MITNQQQQLTPEEQRNIASIMIQKIEEAYNLARMPKMLKRYMEMENIAEYLSEKQLEDIASLVIDSTNTDEASRSEWEALAKKIIDMVDANPKPTGKEWGANINYPMIMSACMQFNARTMPEIIKNDKVVLVRSMAPDEPSYKKNTRADNLSAHMSYQLLGQSDHWIYDTDQLLIMLPLLGTVFRKSFYNSITKQPDTRLVNPLDVVVNKKTTSMEDAQRVTHKFWMSANDIIENMNAGIFSEYSIDELMLMSDSEFQVNSYTTDDELKNAFYDSEFEVYEQHRYLDLDGDGYQEPYIVTVLKNTQKVLRIVARYDENSIEYTKNDKMVRINPVNYWTEYRFIPDPSGGFYGIGFGAMLLHTNEVSNSLLNQLVDSGTLANMQGGFISRNLRLPKGDFSFKPGEFKQVNNTVGTSIAENILMLPAKEPSQVLFVLLQFVIDSSKTITAISDIMQGDLPPSSTPAATTMAVVEQGQKIYSAILYRIYNSLKKEFCKLYEINKKYIQDSEQFVYTIGSGIITVDDYKAPNYGIFPIADPQLSSQMQRLIQSQALMQLAGDPRVNGSAIIKNYLEALKVPNIDEILFPPPDPNSPPSIQEQLQEADLESKKAEIKNKNVDTICMLIDRELKAKGIDIDANKQKSETSYFGGMLASSKVDSIVKLTQLMQQVPARKIEQATKEEEALTQSTQEDQYVSHDVKENIETLVNAQNIKSNIDMQQTQQQGVVTHEQSQSEGNIPSLTLDEVSAIVGGQSHYGNYK